MAAPPDFSPLVKTETPTTRAIRPLCNRANKPMPIICFFGTDGSGKTTPSRNLAKRILSYQPTISLEEGLRKPFYNDLE